MRRLCFIMLFGCVAFLPSVRAFEFLPARGAGMGQTILLSQPSASSILNVPSLPALPGCVTLQLGASRQYEIKDLDQTYLAAACRTRSFTWAAGLSQFGSAGRYAERIVRLAAAGHYRAFSIGSALSIMHIDFGEYYSDLSAVGVSLSAGYRKGRALFAAAAENLNSPRLECHSEPIRPAFTLYGELIGPGPYSLTGRITAQRWEKPQFGVGQFIDVSSCGSIFWGLATAPLIYGGGLELSHKRAIITYAISYHPVLGLSHSLSVSFELGKSAGR